MSRRSVAFSTVLAALALSAVGRADSATEWNRVALDLVASRSYSPPIASRALAIVSVAMSDAANAVDRRYEGYAYNGTASGADVSAAVSRAACDSLKALFPNDAVALEARFQSGSYGVGAELGAQVGSASAAAILSKRLNDGSANTAGPYTGSNEPGMWRPTGPANLPGLLPEYGRSNPWNIQSGDQFRAPAPPTIGSARFAADLDEVRAIGRADSTTRTAEQTQIARFWAAGAGTVTPPGMWNEIATTVAGERNLSIQENARNLALLNTSLADAAIACWDSKYAYSYWRPITAAQATDPSWASLLVTPNFPSYVSGHSTFSATAATVLGSIYGDATSFSETVNGTTRNFASFWQAAEEAGRSRIYGGIHYQFDNEQGLAMGRSVGGYAIDGGHFRAVPEPATLAALGLGFAAFARRRRRS